MLIDTSSVLYRNFHALPEMHSAKGFPTNALLGTMRTIEMQMNEHPDACVVALMDSGEPGFRKEIYPEYKANRSAMPDDLLSQVKVIDEIINARGVPTLRREGIEADDLIASIIAAHGGDYGRIHILTMDKDLAQLVDERVHILYGKANEEIGIPGVRRKFNVEPGQILDYLALIGDQSDNIPGVRGVGPKTAAKILGQAGSIDEFLESAAEGDKLRAKIEASRESIQLAKRLISLKTDIGISAEELHNKPPDLAALRSLYQEYDLKSLLAQLDRIDPGQADALVPSGEPAAAEAQPQAFDLMGFSLTVVRDKEQLEKMCASLADASLVCLDTETTGLDYNCEDLVGIAFAIEPDRAWYLPLLHQGGEGQLLSSEALEALEPILNDKGKAFLGHNLKFDRNMLSFASAGSIDISGAWHDSMLQACLLRSASNERIGLDALAQKTFGRKNISYGDLIKKYAKQQGKRIGETSFADIAIDEAAQYAAEDAVVCLRLYQEMRPRIESSDWRARCYTHSYLPLARILAHMERCGIGIDETRMRKAGAEFSRKGEEAQIAIEDIAGRVVNPDSPRDLADVIFGQLGLPVLARTPGGQPSTNAAALDRLSEEFPDVELLGHILAYRSAHKFKRTYVDDLLERIEGGARRIHTHFSQGITLTGRLSSDSPNLQNIPVRNEDGLLIRGAFVADEGWRFLGFDYSQIELRIIAHLSEDASLVRAFAEGHDAHSFTAAEIFGVEPDEVSAEQRRVAKMINFGLAFGMTAHGLSTRMRMPLNEARDYIKTYFERYPGVNDYMERTRKLAREKGWVETLAGRQIPISHISDRNAARRQHAERVAINAPVQGSGADIIGAAMIAIEREGLAFGDGLRLLLQVHDELVFEVREELVDELQGRIAKLMTEAMQLRVPLTVKQSVGHDWAELSR